MTAAMSATQRLLMAFYFDLVPMATHQNGAAARAIADFLDTHAWARAADLANESETRCVACGQPTRERHSLPVNASGDVVTNMSQRFEGSVPSCESCYRVHKSGGPHGADVLHEHVRAVRALHVELDARRSLIKGIETLCAESTVT